MSIFLTWSVIAEQKICGQGLLLFMLPRSLDCLRRESRLFYCDPSAWHMQTRVNADKWSALTYRFQYSFLPCPCPYIATSLFWEPRISPEKTSTQIKQQLLMFSYLATIMISGWVYFRQWSPSVFVAHTTVVNNSNSCGHVLKVFFSKSIQPRSTQSHLKQRVLKLCLIVHGPHVFFITCSSCQTWEVSSSLGHGCLEMSSLRQHPQI